jgi:signal transduction histidine kinase
LKAEPSHLQQLCEKAVLAFTERAATRSMQVSVDISQNVPLALVDPLAFERILTNLIDNALKYCADGARIRITAAEAGSKLQVSVSDNGPGIELQHQPRLFERFYRPRPLHRQAFGRSHARRGARRKRFRQRRNILVHRRPRVGAAS